MEVKNTVLLEDRTEHGLDDNTWAWVGDERGLLMQLLGEEVNAQIEDFVQETERKGRAGLLHHWVMVRPWDEFILGLVGFDRVTRSNRAVWNLGYWVRSSEQQHGIARKSIDAALRWLGQIEDLAVELKVDPKNEAGRHTVMRAVRNWGGERCIEGDSAITVAGVRTLHECHIIAVGPGKGP